MSTNKLPKGVRLREFAPIVDRTYNSFRALLQADRDNLPFEPAGEGERLLYTAEHAIAVAATDLLVDSHGMSFPEAAHCVFISNAVPAWFYDYGESFDTNSIRLVSYSTWDNVPHRDVVSCAVTVSRLEDINRILDNPKFVSLCVLPVIKAVQLAKSRAVAAGYEMRGRDLLKELI